MKTAGYVSVFSVALKYLHFALCLLQGTGFCASKEDLGIHHCVGYETTGCWVKNELISWFY